MSGRVDATLLLERALTAVARDGGVNATVRATGSRRWASATFVGARHYVTVVGADDPALDSWLASLPEADLPLRGHLVADLAVVAQHLAEERRSATIEVLTVEEA